MRFVGEVLKPCSQRRSRSGQQQRTTAAFAQACSEPRSGQMLGFLLAGRRADVLVFFHANCSTDAKMLDKLFCTDYYSCTDNKSTEPTMNAYATRIPLPPPAMAAVRRAIVELSTAAGQWLTPSRCLGSSTQQLKDRAYTEADLNPSPQGLHPSISPGGRVISMPKPSTTGATSNNNRR